MNNSDGPILVTGGAGFIGSHLVDALVSEGHEVHVLDNLSTGHASQVHPEAELHVVDLRSREETNACLSAIRPAVVFHQAAQASVARSVRGPSDDAAVNILGSLHLLDGCADNGVRRVVFASTGGAIYGEVPEGTAATVEMARHPISPYGCAKLSVEHYLRFYRRERGIQTTVLRYANVYGPRQDPAGEAGVVAIFIERLRSGQPLLINARRAPGDAGCVRDYVHIDDVVRANLLALHGEMTEVHNISSGVGTSTRALAITLIDALFDRAPAEEELLPGEHRAGDLERAVLQPDLQLGAIRSLEEGLRTSFR